MRYQGYIRTNGERYATRRGSVLLDYLWPVAFSFALLLAAAGCGGADEKKSTRGSSGNHGQGGAATANESTATKTSAAGTGGRYKSGSMGGSWSGSGGAQTKTAVTTSGLGASGAVGGTQPPRGTGSIAIAGTSGSTSNMGGTGVDQWGPGDYPPDVTEQTYLEISGVPGQNDYVRQYKVHVPSSYDPSIPAPLLFCIHGLFEDPVMFCVTGASMPAKSDKEGFILVMPLGYERSWNAGTCCGTASQEQLDDVALFRAVVTEVAKHVNIDRKRVYATGLSNGGYMSFRLACEAADLFAAVAPGAGAVGTNDTGEVGMFATNVNSDFTTCKPSRPISVLAVHGTGDALISYSVHEPSVKLMARDNGCSSMTQRAKLPPSSGDTTCVSYKGCPEGIDVVSCAIENGGHCWFGSPDCGTGAGDLGLLFVGNNSDTMNNTDAVWDFLKSHSL